MSDLKYRTDFHLINTVSYCKRKANTFQQRTKAAQDVLDSRYNKLEAFSTAVPIQSTYDARWRFMDQNDTPFWHASFDSQANALYSRDQYVSNLTNAANQGCCNG
jgi:thioester reductase-like protein